MGNSDTNHSIAVVVPRFGASLGGGAETLVRELLLQLQQRYGERCHIEVWTTCAVDHRTWENYFKAGITEEDGITIRRFKVDDRDLEVFVSAERALQLGRRLSPREQLAWLRNSVNSSDLYLHIAEHGKSFDHLLFAPYLFATSFWGALIYPERSVLLPCLHDEVYAYFEVFGYLFAKVRGLIFNASAEMQLAYQLYGKERLEHKSAVVGMGFELHDKDVERASFEQPYVLYSGRKEEGKNVDYLITRYSQFIEKYPKMKLQLRLIGKGSVSFLDELPEGVIDMGFVSELEKKALMKGALVLCQPSLNESFSIVMMESWLQSVPVMVHQMCAVTSEHVSQSNGGFVVDSQDSFNQALLTLLSEETDVASIGEAGKNYVETEYSWNAVIERYEDAIQKFSLGNDSTNMPLKN